MELQLDRDSNLRHQGYHTSLHFYHLSYPDPTWWTSLYSDYSQLVFNYAQY